MISNAEIERYRDFATIRSARKIGSVDEQNLALMVINLIAVIDHLSSRLLEPGELAGLLDKMGQVNGSVGFYVPEYAIRTALLRIRGKA